MTDNGKRVVKFCAERALFVGNTYFNHRRLHKYTSQDGVDIKSMMDLVLVQRDMLHCVQDVKAVRGMGRSLSDHHVVLCKVRLVVAWIKKRGMVVGARMIRSDKLKEHQYSEGYARSFEGKGIEYDEDNKGEHMWEQKRAMVVCVSMRVGGKNPKSVVVERRDKSCS